jgi:hypothetical protein
LAALGLALVPVLYLIAPASRLNDLSFTYATHYLAAHWIATGAVMALAAAGVLGGLELRSARRREAFAPAAEGETDNGRGNASAVRSRVQSERTLGRN